MRYKRKNNIPETFSIWTSFTDLMSNAFMIMTLLLLFVISGIPRTSSTVTGVPPIIVLDATKYEFMSGSAQLPNTLKDNFQSIKDEIENYVKEYKVDVIEVIGHTDAQEVSRIQRCNSQKLSNLDRDLEKAVEKEGIIDQLCPGSNVDLGLMRAITVVKELQKSELLKTSSGKKIGFRAYSSGQLIQRDGSFSSVPKQRKADPKRRRIEIRCTQLGEEKI
jgi:hypothetical protein